MDGEQPFVIPGNGDLRFVSELGRNIKLNMRFNIANLNYNGALVWDVVIREVAERSGRGDELTVVSSEHDILDGLALSQV